MADEIDDILKFLPSREVPQEQPEPSEADEVLKFLPSRQEGQGAEAVSTPEAESDLTWKEALVEGFQNIPSSAWETAKNMVEPIFHPIETGKSIGKLAAGAAQKVYPGEQEYEANFDAVVDFFKKRYGSIDKLKKTIAEDPVGISTDIASLFTGAGAAVRGVGAVGKLSKVSAVGKAVQDLGGAMEPLNVARKIAATPLKLVPDKIPMNWYESAVKFGTTLSGKERDAVTRTALKAENQIMPTAKGMEKLRGMIDDYNSEISSMISETTAKGTQLNVGRLYHGLDKIKEQIKRTSDEPLKVENAFAAIKKQWKEAIKVDPLRTPTEVQQLKIRIYKELESLYEKHKATPAKSELRKAVARNAREMLEGIMPEIKQLNQKEGSLIELWDAIETKANRITNRDLIGIGLPVKMGTGSGIGYMFGGPKGAAIGTTVGFALGIFDTPQVKAKTALVVSRLKEKGITVKPTTAAIKLGLFQSGREEETE